MSEDIGVLTEGAAVVYDSEQTNNEHHIISSGVNVNNESMHELDGSHSILIEEVTLDLTQTTAIMEDSGNTSGEPITTNRRVVDNLAEEPNVTPVNVINDIEATLAPIVEYADAPLLPLLEACGPLTDIINNLLSYAQLALSETPEQPPNGLTIDESAAIRLYTIEWEENQRSLYSMLNHTLKKDDRDKLRPYFKYMKLFLTALVKLPCVPPLTVWRGVTKDISAQFPPGTMVIWWAFSSCTTSLPVLENNMYLGNTGERTLFSVEAINGRTVRDHSHFVTEDEILLLPGTQMIVQSQFSPAPDLHIIHLKQVVPKEVLLQPPFEGRSKFSHHLFWTNGIFVFRCRALSTDRVSRIASFSARIVHCISKTFLVSQEKIHHPDMFIDYCDRRSHRSRRCFGNEIKQQLNKYDFRSSLEQNIFEELKAHRPLLADLLYLCLKWRVRSIVFRKAVWQFTMHWVEGFGRFIPNRLINMELSQTCSRS